MFKSIVIQHKSARRKREDTLRDCNVRERHYFRNILTSMRARTNSDLGRGEVMAPAMRLRALRAGVDGDRAAGGDSAGEGAAGDGEPRWTECALNDQAVIVYLSSMHLRAACAVAVRRRAADDVAVGAIRKRRRERCRPVRVRVVDRHEAESACTTCYTIELTRTHPRGGTYRGQMQSAQTAARPSRSTPRHQRCS